MKSFNQFILKNYFYFLLISAIIIYRLFAVFFVTVMFFRKENLKMEDIIKKINEFSRLARERDLTGEEKKEREKYRRMYIEKFRKV